MVVDMLGVRPSQSKVDAVAQLTRANTVEEVKTLLGMTGYLRKFVSKFIALETPILNLLRDKNFASKRERKLKVPWGEEQDKALTALILALTSPPILVMPDWDKSFQLHTDASKLGAGAVLTQIHEGSERVLGHASHRRSRADARRSPT